MQTTAMTSAELTRPPRLDRPVQFRISQDEYEVLKSLAWGQNLHVATYVTQVVRAALAAHQADQAS